MRTLKPVVICMFAFLGTACDSNNENKPIEDTTTKKTGSEINNNKNGKEKENNETNNNKNSNEINKNKNTNQTNNKIDVKARYTLVKAKSDKNFLDYYGENFQKSSYDTTAKTDKTAALEKAKAESTKVSDSKASNSSGSKISTTNLIEQGVDELDFVKQNNTHIFTTKTEKLPDTETKYNQYKHSIKIYAKPNTNVIASLDINNAVGFKGLYLLNKQLFTLKQKTNQEYGYGIYEKNGKTYKGNTFKKAEVALDVVNVANELQPKISKNYVWDGNYKTSRRIGNNVYVVTETLIEEPNVCAYYTKASVQSDMNTKVVGGGYCNEKPMLTPEEIAKKMPIDISGKKIKPSECFIPSLYNDKYINKNVTLITKVDLTGNENHKTTCIAASVNEVYMSPKSVYVTKIDYGNKANEYQPETIINKFDLKDNDIKYAGGASVIGDMNWGTNGFNMNEHQGVLRIFTRSWNKGNLTNYLHTLKASETNLTLNHLATIPNASQPKKIGKPNERIKSIRFMGDEAYAVTFETKDPLYKIDLSNPSNPIIKGELEMPGYSAYLHRINNKYLMGVGFTVDKNIRKTGIQTTIFDTSAANPVIVDQDTVLLKPETDVNNQYLQFKLALESDSRAITTLTNEKIMRVAIPYKVQNRSYDSNIMEFKNNALEYKVSTETGKIVSKYKRQVNAPLIIKKNIDSKNSNDIEKINKAHRDFQTKIEKAQNGFYEGRERALFDNEDIYYNLYDGSLVKYLWSL